jgi:hypothetical protein
MITGISRIIKYALFRGYAACNKRIKVDTTGWSVSAVWETI